MRVVAEANGWAVSADTWSDRVRVGPKDELRFVEARWDGGALWVDPPGRPLPESLLRPLAQALGYALAAMDPHTQRELDALVTLLRARVQPPQPNAEVVVSVARRAPVCVTVEVYGAVEEPLADWWMSVYCEMPEGFDFGFRSSVPVCRDSDGRRGVASDFSFTARPRWPPVAGVDPYRVLGLTEGAPAEEVTEAYRRLIKLNHPDRVAHLSEALQRTAHEETLRIQSAYEAIRGRG